MLRSVGMRGAFAEGERGSVEAERNVNKIATLSIGSIEFAMTVGKITLLTSILSLISVILMQNIIKKGNIVWRENPKNTL